MIATDCATSGSAGSGAWRARARVRIRERRFIEIQAAVEIPGPTLSHHLDLLRRAGLVESRKEERYIYYSVQRETATTLARLLTACC